MPTMRSTEWLPASCLLLTRFARWAGVTPRAAIGDRGRSVFKMEKYNNRRLIGGGEGFAIYFEESGADYFLIVDESTTLDLLSDEDKIGLTPEKVLRFSSAHERKQHLNTIKYLPIGGE